MTAADATRRPPLNRDRIVRAAVDLMDREGIDALTMRRLGAELGVEAMAIYKHVAKKEEILDAVLELVISEIEIPDETADWKQAMRRRAVSARQVLSRHSWAVGLLEARGATGPSAMRYLDAILGSLRSAGFSIEHAAHAFWLLDSYVYGHVIQEARLTESARPSSPGDSSSHEFPHLAELEAYAARFPFSIDTEFEFGLDLILDALR